MTPRVAAASVPRRRLEETFARSGQMIVHQLARPLRLASRNGFGNRFVLREDTRQAGRFSFDRSTMKLHAHSNVVLEGFHRGIEIIVLRSTGDRQMKLVVGVFPV